MGDKLIFSFKTILVIAAICFSVYAIYWVTKTGSYFLFYESMVTETIEENVIEACLIKNQ